MEWIPSGVDLFSGGDLSADPAEQAGGWSVSAPLMKIGHRHRRCSLWAVGCKPTACPFIPGAHPIR